MKITLIAAIGDNNELGRNGNLIWKIPDDLKNFKTLTMGHMMLMGRKTWDSIGKRPLPGRTHLIISHEFMSNEPDKRVFWFKNINDALNFAQNSETELFVIGGATIYKQLLPFATNMYISHIHDTYKDADAFFPDIVWTDWIISEIKDMSSYEGIDWSFASYNLRS